MEGLVESASLITLAIIVLTLAFICLFYALRAFPEKRGVPMFSSERGIEHMDSKQYEDLKLEYIRRKMERNEKMAKQDEEMANSMSGSGSTTRFTDANDDEGRGRGVFGKAMDFIFSDQKNESYQGEIQLSTKDLMWAGAQNN